MSDTLGNTGKEVANIPSTIVSRISAARASEEDGLIKAQLKWLASWTILYVSSDNFGVTGGRAQVELSLDLGTPWRPPHPHTVLVTYLATTILRILYTFP